jgi:hypothetical protein
MRQPSSLARRRSRSLRSRRSGAALCSTATPSSAARRRTAPMSSAKGLAAQQQAAGGMAEDAHIGIFDGAQDAGGHLFAALLKAGVNAGDDDVHLGEDFVVQVERAVGEDVDLDAGEDADAAFHLPVDFANALDVFEGALLVEAVGHGQVLGVVGDGDVLGSRRPGRPRPFRGWSCGRRWRWCACAGRRDVALDEPGQGVAAAASISPRFSRSSGASSPCPGRRRSPPRWRRRRSSRRRGGPGPTR